MIAPLSPKIMSPFLSIGTFPAGYKSKYYLFLCSLFNRSTIIKSQGICPISIRVLTARAGWLPMFQQKVIWAICRLLRWVRNNNKNDAGIFNHGLYRKGDALGCECRAVEMLRPRHRLQQCSQLGFMRIISCDYNFKQSMQNEQQPNQEPPRQAEEYDTFLYKFQQQIIDAWKPVPHTSSNVILYIILSAICIGLGLGLILSAPTTQEIYLQYDNVSGCTSATNDNTFTSTCKVSFQLTDTLQAPIYVYYGLKGFYQNHRRYLKYFSPDQLSEGSADASGASSDCGDYYTNSQTFGSTAKSLSNALLDGSKTAFPCGTISRAYYQFRNEIKGFKIWDQTTTNEIAQTKTGIAWPSDIGRHKDTSSAQSTQPFSVTQEQWLVWFRPAARSDFYKLNGIINKDMPKGKYRVTFFNEFSSSFGSKWFSISKSNFVGNRDLFLGIAFLALGGGCFILLIIFLAKWITQTRNKNSTHND